MADQWKTAVKYSHGIAIPKSADRTYKAVTLENGLKVLLIHDPKTEFAASSLSVSVGSFADPKNLQGAFHFLEHLLFMGTERYPDENDYSAYLADHGGYSNAWTAGEETCYQLEVAPDALQGALDRFSAFFVCPLFNPSSTARELNAVDAEHAKNKQQDGWRMYQLDKSTSREGHPYAKFGTGDSRTLRDAPEKEGLNVRETLLGLHRAHYSASRMTLAILGRDPLEALEGWAKAYFSPVSNNGSTAPVIAGHPYDGIPPALQYAIPVKDTRSLSVCWALPEERSAYAAKPSNYVSHLIGHEGPGSLLSYLKAQGWALGLHAGANDKASGYTTFEVGIELTEAGLGATEDILRATYAYIGMLRALGPQRWVWEEEAAQAAASFRFQNKSRPLNECVHATSSLLLYPAEHVFAGGSLYMAWQPELIKRSLEHLTPARSRVRLVAKALADKCTAEEPWYGTKYGQVPLSDAQIASYTAAAEAYARLVAQRSAGGSGSGGSAAAGAAATGDDAWAAGLTPALALPAPNEFIPTDFTLRHPELASKQAEAESTVGASLGGDAEEEGEEEDEGNSGGEEEEAAEGAADATTAAAAAAAPKSLLPPRRRREPVPSLVRDDARATVWFRQDDRFAQPKTYFKAEITLPAAYATPRANVLTDLFNRLLTESLNEFAYAADIAGLRYSTSVSARGLAMGAGGFSHKLAALVAKVAERMADLTFTDAQFAIYKDKATRDLENWAVEQPLQHALYATNIALIAPLWHNDAKLAAVRSVTAEELRAFQRVLLSQSHVRCLVVGNATGEEAAGVADALLRPLTAVSGEVAPAQHVTQRCAKLPPPLVLLPEAPSGAGSVLSSIAAAVLHPQGGGRDAASSGSGREGTALVWELRHSQVSRNGEDPNSAMEYVFQIGPTSVGPLATQAALFRLALHLLSEPFFDSLRTKQQLGYIVNAGFRQDSGVRALRLLIQSNKVSGAELVRRTDAFLAATFPAFLAAMSPAKYAQNVGAVIAQANEDDKSLAEESNGLWAEIADGRLDFERARHVTDALVGLSQADFIAWYHEHMSPGGARRRVFVSVVEPVSPAAMGAANDAAAPADVHAEGRVVAAAAAAAGSNTAAAAADGDAAAAAAALAQQGEVPASPAAGEAVPADVAASAGGGLARTDAVGTPVAGDAAAAAGGEDEEAGAAAAAERFAASETVAHLTLAQAAVVQQALAAAGLEGGRIAAADAALVTACFAEAGVSISGFAERAARSPAPAGAQRPYVRCLVSVAHPENVKAVLPMYAPLGTARYAAWREKLIAVTAAGAAASSAAAAALSGSSK